MMLVVVELVTFLQMIDIKRNDDVGRQMQAVMMRTMTMMIKTTTVTMMMMMIMMKF